MVYSSKKLETAQLIGLKKTKNVKMAVKKCDLNKVRRMK